MKAKKVVKNPTEVLVIRVGKKRIDIKIKEGKKKVEVEVEIVGEVKVVEKKGKIEKEIKKKEEAEVSKRFSMPFNAS